MNMLKKLAYFICGLLAAFGLLFSSVSSASAFELSANVYSVDFASDPRFIIKGTHSNGISFSSGYLTAPYSLLLGDTISGIEIVGNRDSWTESGWKWKAGDYFSVNLAFYSASDGCSNNWPGSLSYRSDSLEQIDVKLVNSYNNASICYTQWNVIFRAWTDSDTNSPLYFSPSNMNAGSFNSSRIYIGSVSQWRPSSTSGSSGTGEFDKEILDKISQSTEYQKEQAEATNQIKDFITNTDQPQASDIVGSANDLPSLGFLPAGPVDSIITLPLYIMQKLENVLFRTGACKPISVPLPFVNKNIELPCIGKIIYQGDFSALLRPLGVFPYTFILFFYFKHLYKKVERAVSLQTTEDDEWGLL